MVFKNKKCYLLTTINNAYITKAKRNNLSKQKVASISTPVHNVQLKPQNSTHIRIQSHNE